MSATLLLRLAGPLQGWGTASRFSVRDTIREPSKSGVLGLVCAALGRPRDAFVDDLIELRFGVRVDHEGEVQRDFQTVGGSARADDPLAHKAKGGYFAPRADGSHGNQPVVSSRYYLADADFLAGLEGEDEGLLAEIEEGLLRPRWQLFLGRKACPPAVPVTLPGGGVRAGVDLETALMAEPWPRIGMSVPRRRPEQLRFVLTAGPDEAGGVLDDEPLGPLGERRFGPRSVRTVFHALGSEIPMREA